MPEIYALYGKSGTGKSHRAINVAYKNNIPLIIDDGLLIYKGKKIPGSLSGKQEANRLRAVKRAIFENQEYAQQMQARIQAMDPDKILIIGTSLNMINKIVTNLQLKQPDHWIEIDEITSSEERSKASYHRSKGRHVVPLSPVEVRKSFKVPLLDRLKLLITSKGTTEYLGEQSVVKPSFHSLGGIYIQEKAIQDIARHALTKDLKHFPPGKIKEIKIYPGSNYTNIEVQLIFKLDDSLHLAAKDLQTRLQNKLRHLTELEKMAVKVVIAELEVPKEYYPD